MGAGAYIEPFVVIFLLVGGSWVNRASYSPRIYRQPAWRTPGSSPFERQSDSGHRVPVASKNEDGGSRSLSPPLLPSQESRWRTRELRIFSYTTKISSPNTAVFKKRILSRLLHKFPFLVECWYWALIYWIYQLGRAFTAVTIVEGTVHVARRHALQLIELERKWHIFWEIPIQEYLMVRPNLMTMLNWLYSFIHIPGTIAFLVWLYYYTITRNRLLQNRHTGLSAQIDGSPSGPSHYEARRRTMAVCNLLAFVVFTAWPCMPPRLLSDPNVRGPSGEIARSFRFVDTVHGEKGAGSVWTQNRFCNQYAAMPSLHFGYSLMIGLTIMIIPLAPQHRRSKSLPLPFFNHSHPELAPRIPLPSWRRVCCILIGFLYPFSILVAIIATANHFILDAVAGAIVCALGWTFNDVLLNLLPLEDYFLWYLRIHKPVLRSIDAAELTPGAESAAEKTAVMNV